MVPQEDILTNQAIELLKTLIATPSLSKEEHRTADIIENFLHENGIKTQRHLNNVWALSRHFDDAKPTILLNSHHDTVKPNTSYTKDPYSPIVENGRLYGLGSNDAGGCLVSLLASFRHFYTEPDLPFNIVFLASAEEEISGSGGVEAVWPLLPKIDLALVGEPTLLNLAIAEKGLMVLDATCHGIAGHAARDEGKNAIYEALSDISWIKNHVFERVSPLLGHVKMSVTLIKAGSQHNVVPDTCSYTIDLRATEAYTFEEILETLHAHLKADIRVRSLRLRPSSIDPQHPLVLRGLALGAKTFGSPTLSDQALMPVPSLKCGPGDSARSHMADEYIHLSEIGQGIAFYISLLKNLHI